MPAPGPILTNNNLAASTPSFMSGTTASATASGSQATQPRHEVCMPGNFLPDETQPEFITRATLPMYCPNWASIYKDILTAATSGILTRPLTTLWMNQEELRTRKFRTKAQLMDHPLYLSALHAVQIVVESDELRDVVFEDSRSKSQFQVYIPEFLC